MMDPGHSAADQKLLETFYRATNSEGGTADEIYLRGIHAVISHSSKAAGTEALAVRPLLERIARIDPNTTGEIMVLSQRAAAWLAENPPGQPVAIEPRGCPTPGACSCVEPAPPVVGEVAELLERQQLKPVPVSEKPWEREGWCDERGSCWLLDRDGRTWKLMTCEWMLLPGDLRYRWLLPANALPLPS